jgi:signal transduction histidine kinase
LAVALTSLLLSTGLAVLAYVVVRGALIDDRESSALRQTYTNARVMRSALRSADPGVAEVLAGLQTGGDSGTVLVTASETFTSSVDVSVEALPSELVAAVSEGRVGRQRIRGEDGPLLVVGVPIEASDADYYEITSLADIERTLRVLASSLGVGAAAATSIGAAVGAGVSGAVLRPLRSIADVARRIVDGQLDSRLPVERDRDLAPLADAFNEMLDELRERIRREARFASDVSHELRGPLTVLAAAVEVVERRRPDLPAEAARAVAALDAQVRSFNQLVGDLLEISRFEAGSAELNTRLVDVGELVEALLVDRPVPQPKVVREKADLHAELDPRRLHQVVSNLLDNADRYAGGATTIVVDSNPSGGVRIAVEDAGLGVPPQERQLIFERFARGSAAQRQGTPRGSGLGLALCANHVELHGGRVYVEDGPLGGARFVVELPEKPT